MLYQLSYAHRRQTENMVSHGARFVTWDAEMVACYPISGASGADVLRIEAKRMGDRPLDGLACVRQQTMFCARGGGPVGLRR